jgi:hypothetical protein
VTVTVTVTVTVSVSVTVTVTVIHYVWLPAAWPGHPRAECRALMCSMRSVLVKACGVTAFWSRNAFSVPVYIHTSLLIPYFPSFLSVDVGRDVPSARAPDCGK